MCYNIARGYFSPFRAYAENGVIIRKHARNREKTLLLALHAVSRVPFHAGMQLAHCNFAVYTGAHNKVQCFAHIRLFYTHMYFLDPTFLSNEGRNPVAMAMATILNFSSQVMHGLVTIVHVLWQ